MARRFVVVGFAVLIIHLAFVGAVLAQSRVDQSIVAHLSSFCFQESCSPRYAVIPNPFLSALVQFYGPGSPVRPIQLPQPRYPAPLFAAPDSSSVAADLHAAAKVGGGLLAPSAGASQKRRPDAGHVRQELAGVMHELGF